MNTVVLIGRLARDPELSYTPNTQTAVCRFTLAVDRPKRQGETQNADFIRVVVYGKQAENCSRYLSKGRQAAVHGRIETGSYKNKDGQTVYTTDVIADRVEFLGTGNAQPSGQNGNTAYGDQNNLPPAMQAAGNVPPQQMQPQQQMQQQIPPQQMQPQQQMSMNDIPDSFQAAEDDIPF